MISLYNFIFYIAVCPMSWSPTQVRVSTKHTDTYTLYIQGESDIRMSRYCRKGCYFYRFALVQSVGQEGGGVGWPPGCLMFFHCFSPHCFCWWHPTPFMYWYSESDSNSLPAYNSQTPACTHTINNKSYKLLCYLRCFKIFTKNFKTSNSVA